jgi:hypothetical protein
VGDKGGGFLVPAEENIASILRIFDLFIAEENPETPGG